MFEKTLLGIELGSRNIKLVYIKDGKHKQILDTIIVPTPNKAIVDGEIKDIEEISKTIKNIISDKKIKPKNLAVCISSNHTVVRQFTLPNLKENEIYDALEMDLSKSFPGISQTHTISFKIYSKTKEQIHGIVAVCPNKILQDQVQICDILNIPIKSIDVNANCIVKTFKNYMGINDKKTILVIDIGHEKSQVNIISNEELIISRNIPIGGSNIDKIVSNTLNISLEEAEMQKTLKYKKYIQKGYNVEKYIRQGYGPIIDEVKQTMNLYRENGYDDEISCIYLIGGGCLVSDVDKYFEEMLNMSTLVVKPSHNNTIYINDFYRFIATIGVGIRED